MRNAGYQVTRAMGVRLAKISPTRGFAAELATALIITIAAQYGLPTSSSQCITGDPLSPVPPLFYSDFTSDNSAVYGVLWSASLCA